MYQFNELNAEVSKSTAWCGDMIINKQDGIIADCVDRETSGLYGSKVVVVDDWTQASRRTLTVLIRL